MALPIIAAIRQHPDLKESLLHTAQELAHLASIYGVARVSYGYLAMKCHCSRRTVLRHIQRLIDLGIVRKTVLWIRGNFCEINTYTFRIAWDTRGRTGGSDTTARTLPPQEGEKNSALTAREKTGAVADALAKQRWGLHNLYEPGSDRWHRTQEEIARLEALLAREKEGAHGTRGRRRPLAQRPTRR